MKVNVDVVWLPVLYLMVLCVRLRQEAVTSVFGITYWFDRSDVRFPWQHMV